MSDQRVQNYSNHAHLPKEFIIETVMMLIVLGIMAFGVYMAIAPGEGEEVSTGAVVLALGFLLHAAATTMIFVHLRFTALKLQDRLVRQEMRFRLSQCLPDNLKPRICEFETGQLIAMRFACDQQLPDLAKEVLDENIQDKKEIKKRVKNWQADWMRI